MGCGKRMNWLAHVFLSEQNIDQQLGNYLADPLKGRVWDGASDDLVKGMEIHKIIDAYTDSHKIVYASKARLKERGRLKPVIVDLTYDYLLTKNWDLFSRVSMQKFTKTFYMQAQKKATTFPDYERELVLHFIKVDGLNKYHELKQLREAFERIDKRLSPKLFSKESATEYFEIVCEQIDDLENDFLSFFPDLCHKVKENSQHANLNHWKL
jgi:acyl carrier protein phosphodiesterase